MASNRTFCFTCNKEKIVFPCQGCSNNFCRNDLIAHHQSHSQELTAIENDHDQFQQTISEQTENNQNHAFEQQIDQWEQNSIEKIKQTAQQCRQSLHEHLNRLINQIPKKFMQLTEQLKTLRRDDEFNEIDIDHLEHQLTQIRKELHQPSTILIREDSSSPFINKLSVQSSLEQMKWKENATTIAGGNGQGNKLKQLSSPNGISIDHDQTIYIADSFNHRIVQWKSGAKEGKIIAGGHGEGNRMNQLNYPTDVCVDQQNNSLIIADWGNKRVIRCSIQNRREREILLSDIHSKSVTMDKNGSIYVSDMEKNEVRRWKKGETQGAIVAGGNGPGNQLNQLNAPTFLFVDEDESIYVSDLNNHRVMKWRKDAREGIVVAGGSPNQLSSPYGVIVDHFGQIYVADAESNRVMRWCEGSERGKVVVGRNGKGDGSNQFSAPVGLSFDVEGNLYVSDFRNHRIQKFELDFK